MRRILVTGVTKGLGRALTAGLIEAGHGVVGCGRSPDAIATLATQYPAPHDFATVDLTSATAVATWADHVLATGAPPDLIINNAGVMNRLAPLWEIPDTAFTEVMDVNVRGVVNILRNFVPALIKAGTGLIVNFSSGWGRSTSPEVAPYCASKWAIEGLTQALSQELPPRLAAIAVNPGIIHTDMLDTCFGHHAAAYPTAAEWSQTAVPFLLSLSTRDNGKSLTIPM